ncbi:MAG TPA: SRPBCC family protein [Bacteroidia bacterium]|nr:SRPBCC family protein [Bacteroidia bacterium]
MENRLYTKKRSILIKSSPEKVFEYMDQLGNTGMHMMKDSAMMMGSKLKLEQLSENAIGLNSRFRWYGRMMGFQMDFTIVVIKWVYGKERIWETIGPAKMIILKWYRMRFELTEEKDSTHVELSITYSRPDELFYKIVSFLFAGIYARWCLKSMLNDTKFNLEGK